MLDLNTAPLLGNPMISLPLLRSVNARDPGLEWFAEHFPDGGTWKEVVAALLADDRADLAAWLGRICHAHVIGATWEARLAVQRNDYDRARLGMNCPAGVPGATWEARLALQQDDYDRALLGRYCPAGVAGATWEARLAVQRNGCDREWLGLYCPASVPGAGAV